MAMGTLYMTVPAVAAAIGFYFLETTQSKSKKHFEGGFQASLERLVSKAREGMKTVRPPKFAPEFDGLHSFETLVTR
uniref:Uncharacterized protein n=1 Tax=Nelumbo nucifera TaxID=4432 RepID=A0A822YUI8_NELNU|nr:TPA_asm: hypothetical protein HUJ06_006810 [Nelumbo nucifera]